MFRYVVAILIFGFASNAIAIAIPGRGIVIEDHFEGRCRPGGLFVTENLRDWTANLTSNTPLYFPLSSSLTLLRFTQYFFKGTDLTFLTPDQVLNSCITVTVDGSLSTLNGYCGQTLSQNVIPVAPKVARWNKGFPADFGGQASVALSDNKSWILYDLCWGDGQRSWTVISLYPTLSECTRKQISDFVKAIGFNEQFFTGLKYDRVTCACPTKHYVSQEPQPQAPYYSPYQTY